MTLQEALHLYTPVKGDEGDLFIGTPDNIVPVKVTSTDGNSVNVIEKRYGRGHKKKTWAVPDWHKPFTIDGEPAVFIDRDGCFRVSVNEGFEMLSANPLIGEAKIDKESGIAIIGENE